MNPINKVNPDFKGAIQEFKAEVDVLTPDQKKQISKLLSGAPNTNFSDMSDDTIKKMFKNLSPRIMASLHQVNPHLSVLASGILKTTKE